MPKTFIKNARVSPVKVFDFATAFAVEDGKFVWVGDTCQVDDENAIDMKGELIFTRFY